MSKDVKYCLCMKRDVKISGKNNMGACPCLNCSLQKCIGHECQVWQNMRSLRRTFSEGPCNHCMEIYASGVYQR